MNIHKHTHTHSNTNTDSPTHTKTHIDTCIHIHTHYHTQTQTYMVTKKYIHVNIYKQIINTHIYIKFKLENKQTLTYTN